MSRPATPKVRDTLIGAVVVFFVMAPTLFTHKAFGYDSTNHAWLIWLQGLAIKQTGHPTLFLSAANQGVMEPYFGFYGGTLYSFAGGISVLTGAQRAYDLTCALFVAMAYRGVWMLSRSAGVRPFVANLPAFVFVTSAYYLTDQYARAAWPEFAALSTLPFSLAYGLRLLRERWTAFPVASFAFGTILLTGSHNISLLWSSVIVLIVGGIAYLAAGNRRPAFKAVRKLFVFTVLCVLVNLWFLALDILHAKDTSIANMGFPWEGTKDFNWLSNTLTFFRTTAPSSTTFGLTIAAPILALVGALWLRTVSSPTESASAKSRRRVMIVLALGVAVLVGMIRMPLSGWEFIGSPFTLIQFPYRLSGWIALGSALVLALSLGLLGSHPGASRRTLAVVAGVFVAVTIVQASYQLFPSTDNSSTNRNRNEAYVNGPAKEPPSWYDSGSYRDVSLPVITVDPARKIYFQLPRPGITTVRAIGDAPEGTEPIQTNIAGGPYVVRLEGKGFEPIGRSDDGYIVIRRTGGSVGALQVTIKADGGATQTLATTVSLVSLVLIVFYVLLLAGRGRRDRRRGSSEPGAPAEPVTDPRDETPAPTLANSSPLGAV